MFVNAVCVLRGEASFKYNKILKLSNAIMALKSVAGFRILIIYDTNIVSWQTFMAFHLTVNVCHVNFNEIKQH